MISDIQKNCNYNKKINIKRKILASNRIPNEAKVRGFKQVLVFSDLIEFGVTKIVTDLLDEKSL